MLQFVPKSWLYAHRRALRQNDSVLPGDTFSVADTLATQNWQPVEDTAEARVLAELSWERGTFTAAVEKSITADRVINFPSPLPQGNTHWDLATLDWHFARDRSGRAISAPAVVVLDILQGGDRVSGYIARTLARKGIHGFVLHLPQNGRRIERGAPHDWSAFLPSLCQGAADARRARDVVASLPTVTGGISIQGTSLGGFVATMAASIDGIFDSTILALTGGDVYSILSNGKMDAARVRAQLRKAGYTDARLKYCLDQLEPLHVAHRLDPQKTWLFTARYDQVVSRIHSQQLARAIGLDWSHHRQLSGCHYSCVINAHRFLTEMVRAIRLSEIRRRQSVEPTKRIA